MAVSYEKDKHNKEVINITNNVKIQEFYTGFVKNIEMQVERNNAFYLNGKIYSVCYVQDAE